MAENNNVCAAMEGYDHRVNDPASWNWCLVPDGGYDAALAIMVMALASPRWDALICLVAGGVYEVLSYEFNLGHVSNAVALWLGMRPADIFVFVFLPPFLLDLSVRIDMFMLKKMIVNVVLMAFVMVITTCLILVPFMLYALDLKSSGWTGGYVALFGAAIASTDAAAVCAALNAGGAPEILSVMLEGESLFNDASSLTLFEVFKEVVTSHESKPLGEEIGHIIVKTLETALVGVAVGIAMGIFTKYIFMWLQRRNMPATMEVGFTVGGAYASFYITQVWCHGSGAMGTVAYGLFGSATLLWGISNKARQSGLFQSFWNIMTFLVNALIFFYVGASSVNFTIRASDQLYEAGGARALVSVTLYKLPIIYAYVFVVRAGFLLVSFHLLKLFRLGGNLSWQECLFLALGGIRGSLSLVLAQTIATLASAGGENPQQDRVKAEAAMYTAGFVIMTLIINAPLTSPMMTLLRLNNISAEQLIMRGHVKQTFFRFTATALEELQAEAQDDEMLQGVDWTQVDKAIDFKEQLDKQLPETQPKLRWRLHLPPWLHRCCMACFQPSRTLRKFGSWHSEVSDAEGDRAVAREQRIRLKGELSRLTALTSYSMRPGTGHGGDREGSKHSEHHPSVPLTRAATTPTPVTEVLIISDPTPTPQEGTPLRPGLQRGRSSRNLGGAVSSVAALMSGLVSPLWPSRASSLPPPRAKGSSPEPQGNGMDGAVGSKASKQESDQAGLYDTPRAIKVKHASPEASWALAGSTPQGSSPQASARFVSPQGNLQALPEDTSVRPAAATTDPFSTQAVQSNGFPPPPPSLTPSPTGSPAPSPHPHTKQPHHHHHHHRSASVASPRTGRSRLQQSTSNFNAEDGPADDGFEFSMSTRLAQSARSEGLTGLVHSKSSSDLQGHQHEAATGPAGMGWKPLSRSMHGTGSAGHLGTSTSDSPFVPSGDAAIHAAISELHGQQHTGQLPASLTEGTTDGSSPTATSAEGQVEDVTHQSHPLQRNHHAGELSAAGSNATRDISLAHDSYLDAVASTEQSGLVADSIAEAVVDADVNAATAMVDGVDAVSGRPPSLMVPEPNAQPTEGPSMRGSLSSPTADMFLSHAHAPTLVITATKNGRAAGLARDTFPNMSSFLSSSTQRSSTSGFKPYTSIEEEARIVQRSDGTGMLATSSVPVVPRGKPTVALGRGSTALATTSKRPTLATLHDATDGGGGLNRSSMRLQGQPSAGVPGGPLFGTQSFSGGLGGMDGVQGAPTNAADFMSGTDGHHQLGAIAERDSSQYPGSGAPGMPTHLPLPPLEVPEAGEMGLGTYGRDAGAGSPVKSHMKKGLGRASLGSRFFTQESERALAHQSSSHTESTQLQQLATTSKARSLAAQSKTNGIIPDPTKPFIVRDSNELMRSSKTGAPLMRLSRMSDKGLRQAMEHNSPEEQAQQLIMEYRLRLLTGLKQYFKTKYVEGLLSPTSYKMLWYVTNKAHHAPDMPLMLWQLAEKEVSSSKLLQREAHFYYHMKRVFSGCKSSTSWWAKQVLSRLLSPVVWLLSAHLSRVQLAGLEAATELWVSLTASLQTQWLQYSGPYGEAVLEEVHENADGVWRYIVDRRIEAPKKFQAIQTYRATVHLLSQQLAFVQEMSHGGMIDEQEASRMEDTMQMRLQRICRSGPQWRKQSVAEILAGVPFLRTQHPKVLAWIRKHSTIKLYKQGECIWEHWSGASAPPSMFIVISGVVRLQMQVQGRQQPIYLGSGGVGGLMSMVVDDEVMPEGVGLRAAYAEGNAMGKGPVVMHIPRELFIAIQRLSREERLVTWQQLELSVFRTAGGLVLDLLKDQVMNQLGLFIRSALAAYVCSDRLDSNVARRARIRALLKDGLEVEAGENGPMVNLDWVAELLALPRPAAMALLDGSLDSSLATAPWHKMMFQALAATTLAVFDQMRASVRDSYLVVMAPGQTIWQANTMVLLQGSLIANPTQPAAQPRHSNMNDLRPFTSAVRGGPTAPDADRATPVLHHAAPPAPAISHAPGAPVGQWATPGMPYGHVPLLSTHSAPGATHVDAGQGYGHELSLHGLPANQAMANGGARAAAAAGVMPGAFIATHNESHIAPSVMVWTTDYFDVQGPSQAPTPLTAGARGASLLVYGADPNTILTGIASLF